MTIGEWGALFGILVACSGVILLAMDERGRKKFASREDLNRVGQKVERNTNLFVTLDDRVGQMEGKFMLLEERQTLQWERISEQMAQTAETIREVTRDLKEVSRMQQDYALRLERLQPRKGD